MRSRGSFLHLSAGTRRGLTLSWLALFIASILLQYGTLASPRPVLAATGLKAGTVQGFEIDGNLKSGDAASNPGGITPSSLIDGTLTNGDDWLDGASFNGVVDPATPPTSTIIHDLVSSTSDDGYGGGAKETDTRTWSYELHKATPKDDVEYAMAYAKFVGNSAFFYAGATRIVNNGDTHIDFELNRKPFKTYSDGISKPNRTVGDVLVSLEFSNGGSDPIVTVYKVTAVTDYPTGQDTTFSTDLATAAAVHSATNFQDLPDEGIGAIPEFEFAETSIDLSALGISTGCPGISSGHIRTRAGGDLDSSQLKDDIQPFPIDLNNCATVNIVKDAVPNSPQDFAFSGSFGAFNLDDDSDATLPNKATFTDVVPGQAYSVTEGLTAGWKLTGLTCDAATKTIDLNGRTATFTPAPNEVITCTYTNQPLGKIIVEKQTLPDGSGQSFEFDPSWSASNFNLKDGEQKDSGALVPGTYGVSEVNLPAGWHLTGVTCSDGSDPSSIDLGYNETVTCVFTNTQDGKIITKKFTDPAGSPDAFEFDPSWGSNFNLKDGEQNDSGFLTPGSGYSVVENTPAGWDLSTVSCSDGSANTNITLSPGEVVTCTFNNRQDGKIIVVKQTNPDGSDASFEFDPSWSASNFNLKDGEQHDSGFLDPGTYSVAELAKAGWDLTSATCSDDSPVTAIQLSAGEVVTCTFTNTQRGHIIVVKQTNPDGSDASFEFDPSWSASNFNLKDGEQHDSGALVPGTYSVAELAKAGWDLTSATCSDDSPVTAIQLSAGEVVTCTFTNTQRGHIIVVKQTNPDGSDASFEFDPSWSASNFNLKDGEQHDSGALVPGTYSVSEIVPSGWDQTGASCDDGSKVDAIDLAAGETVTCIFTNTQRGHIIVVKQTLPDGSSQSFEFDPSWSSSNFNLKDGEQHDSGALEPGNYAVSESVLTGWDLTSAGCDDGSTVASIDLGPGETVTCTFVNTQRGTIIVEKQTSPDGATDTFSFSGDLKGSIGDGEQLTATNLVPGTYTTTEGDPGEAWDLGAITCDDSNSSGDLGTATATFKLDPGETVTCTFFNAQRGTITIIKDARPDSAQDFGFTGDLGSFTLDDDGDASNGTSNMASFQNLVAGSYSVSETGVEGWDLTNLECETTGGASAEIDGATADLNLTDGGSITCVFTNSKPDIQIVKTAGDAADGGTYVTEAFADNVTYHYAVTNTGQVDLVNVAVVDDAGTPADTSDDIEVCTIEALAIGETATCDLTLTVTTDTTNVAVASGETEQGTPVDDDDDAKVDIVTPGIELIKTAGTAADGEEYVTEAFPDNVTYHYAVTNTGEVDLLDVVVVDDAGTPGDTSDDIEVCTIPSIAAGDTETCEITLTVLASTVNVAIATGHTEQQPDEELSDDDDAVVRIPELTIDKSYTGNTGGTTGTGIGLANVGDTLTYTLAYDLTDGPVTNGVITDVLPDGLQYVADSATGNDEFTFDSYDPATRTLRWTAPTVTKNGSVTYQVVVEEGSNDLPQPLINVATISSNETPPDSDEEDVVVQLIEGETATPRITLPPTDSVGDDQAPSNPGFGLMLTLLVLAGIGLAAGQLAPTPARARRETDRRR